MALLPIRRPAMPLISVPTPTRLRLLGVWVSAACGHHGGFRLAVAKRAEAGEVGTADRAEIKCCLLKRVAAL